MTLATTAIPLEERLERLSEQLDEISDELLRQRTGRARWSELAEDLAPLAQEAMALATSHLEADACEFGDMGRLAHSLVRNASVLEAWLGPLRQMSALADELGPLTPPAVASLIEKLQQLDERGYFSFARQAAGVLDTVVTSFSEDDVKLLGDNIVLILQTVKQMTQPEVMNLLNRAALTIRQTEATDGEPPSTLALLKQMRDPQVRRGLARLLTTLRTLGSDQGLGTATADAKRATQVLTT